MKEKSNTNQILDFLSPVNTNAFSSVVYADAIQNAAILKACVFAFHKLKSDIVKKNLHMRQVDHLGWRLS